MEESFSPLDDEISSGVLPAAESASSSMGARLRFRGLIASRTWGFPRWTSVMYNSPPSWDSRMEPWSQFDERASSTFSTRTRSVRRGIVRPRAAEVDGLEDMRAKRRSIEVNGVEILPEVRRVCRPVDTRSDSSSSAMMTMVFSMTMANTSSSRLRSN